MPRVDVHAERSPAARRIHHVDDRLRVEMLHRVGLSDLLTARTVP